MMRCAKLTSNVAFNISIITISSHPHFIAPLLSFPFRFVLTCEEEVVSAEIAAAFEDFAYVESSDSE